MRAELADLNDCAVPFLSRAAINLLLHTLWQRYFRSKIHFLTTTVVTFWPKWPLIHSTKSKSKCHYNLTDHFETTVVVKNFGHFWPLNLVRNAVFVHFWPRNFRPKFLVRNTLFVHFRPRLFWPFGQKCSWAEKGVTKFIYLVALAAALPTARGAADICRGEGAHIKHIFLTTIHWLLTHYLALKNYGNFEIKQVVISMYSEWLNNSGWSMIFTTAGREKELLAPILVILNCMPPIYLHHLSVLSLSRVWHTLIY